MKKLIPLILFYCFAFNTVSFSQKPKFIKYWSQISNKKEKPLSNKRFRLKIDLFQYKESNKPIYSESQQSKTNKDGMFDIYIGYGGSIDDFNTINWTDGPYIAKISIDTCFKRIPKYDIIFKHKITKLPYEKWEFYYYSAKDYCCSMAMKFFDQYYKEQDYNKSFNHKNVNMNWTIFPTKQQIETENLFKETAEKLENEKQMSLFIEDVNFTVQMNDIEFITKDSTKLDSTKNKELSDTEKKGKVDSKKEDNKKENLKTENADQKNEKGKLKEDDNQDKKIKSEKDDSKESDSVNSVKISKDIELDNQDKILITTEDIKITLAKQPENGQKISITIQAKQIEIIGNGKKIQSTDGKLQENIKLKENKDNKTILIFNKLKDKWYII
ncbi:MAG: hypothetical protein N4A49_08260 [Marinifilaceae bacterium]|jgi:hypothetical protein|nr:hypothetical protein [Marinifilaceae bacterium]